MALVGGETGPVGLGPVRWRRPAPIPRDQLGGDDQRRRGPFLVGHIQADREREAAQDERDDREAGLELLDDPVLGCGQHRDHGQHPVLHLLAGVHLGHDGLIDLGEPDERPPLVVEESGDPAQDSLPGLRRVRLGEGPVHELVHRGVQVVQDARENVLLGLEMVVERGSGDLQLLRDLTQRGLLVSLLGEQLQRDLLDPFPGIAAPGVHRGSTTPGRWHDLTAVLVLLTFM